MTSITDLWGGAVPQWDLADRLVKARRHAAVEQAEMADFLGLSRSAVSDFERGRRAPRMAYLRGWADRCGVSLSWLAGQEPPQGLPPQGLPPSAAHLPNGISARTRADLAVAA